MCKRKKRTVTKAKSLFVGGLDISPNLGTEKIARLFIFIQIKVLKIYVACFLKRSPPVMKVFSLSIRDLTQLNRKSIIITKSLI